MNQICPLRDIAFRCSFRQRRRFFWMKKERIYWWYVYWLALPKFLLGERGRKSFTWSDSHFHLIERHSDSTTFPKEKTCFLPLFPLDKILRYLLPFCSCTHQTESMPNDGDQIDPLSFPLDQTIDSLLYPFYPEVFPLSFSVSNPHWTQVSGLLMWKNHSQSTQHLSILIPFHCFSFLLITLSFSNFSPWTRSEINPNGSNWFPYLIQSHESLLFLIGRMNQVMERKE